MIGDASFYDLLFLWLDSFTCDDKIKIRMLYQHYHILHTDKLAYSRARLLISLISHFSCSGISNAALFAVMVIIVVLYVIILLVQQQIHLVSLWRDVEVGETWDDKTPASLWWSNQQQQWWTCQKEKRKTKKKGKWLKYTFHHFYWAVLFLLFFSFLSYAIFMDLLGLTFNRWYE